MGLGWSRRRPSAMERLSATSFGPHRSGVRYLDRLSRSTPAPRTFLIGRTGCCGTYGVVGLELVTLESHDPHAV